jgi:hypothetical protein
MVTNGGQSFDGYLCTTWYPLGITRNSRTLHSELHIGVLVLGLVGVDSVEESVGGASARAAVKY